MNNNLSSICIEFHQNMIPIPRTIPYQNDDARDAGSLLLDRLDEMNLISIIMLVKLMTITSGETGMKTTEER